MRLAGSTAVRGITYRGPFGFGRDGHGQGSIVESAVVTEFRVSHDVAPTPRGIGSPRRRILEVAIFITAGTFTVGYESGLSRKAWPIFVCNRHPIRLHESQVLTVAIQFEVGMVIRSVKVRIVIRAIFPVFFRGKDDRVFITTQNDAREPPLGQIILVVRKIPTLQTDACIAPVVNLNPVGANRLALHSGRPAAPLVGHELADDQSFIRNSSAYQTHRQQNALYNPICRFHMLHR